MIESWLLSGEILYKGANMEFSYKNQNKVDVKILNFVKELSPVERDYFLILLRKKEQIRILKMLVEDRERA